MRAAPSVVGMAHERLYLHGEAVLAPLPTLRSHYSSTTLLVDLHIGDLAAGVLLPNVHHVVEPRDVALLVVAELADHGRELAARLDGLGDLLGIERVCGFRRLLDDLHRSVAVERVGLR